MKKYIVTVVRFVKDKGIQQHQSIIVHTDDFEQWWEDYLKRNYKAILLFAMELTL